MSEAAELQQLVLAARHGDPDAARSLVLRYEPQVRRIVRVRLTDPQLRRQMDSEDLCQSVFGNFFVRLASGQFEIETPAQLVALLAKMAHNRLLQHLEALHTQKRGGPAAGTVNIDEVPLASQDATPSQMIADRELLSYVRRQLSPDEQALAEARAAGESWDALAAQFKSSPEALRKRLKRALDRVTAAIGIGGAIDDE